MPSSDVSSDWTRVILIGPRADSKSVLTPGKSELTMVQSYFNQHPVRNYSMSEQTLVPVIAD